SIDSCGSIIRRDACSLSLAIDAKGRIALPADRDDQLANPKDFEKDGGDLCLSPYRDASRLRRDLGFHEILALVERDELLGNRTRSALVEYDLICRPKVIHVDLMACRLRRAFDRRLRVPILLVHEPPVDDETKHDDCHWEQQYKMHQVFPALIAPPMLELFE